ncbi:hypothetical protein OQA88_8884 [Cercophora sp. LCS_1]
MGNSDSKAVLRQYQRGVQRFLKAADDYEKGGSQSLIDHAVNPITAQLREYYPAHQEFVRFLEWSHAQVIEKRNLDRDLADSKHRLKRLESQNAALTGQLREARAEIKRQEEQRRLTEERHQSALTEQTTNHVQKTQELKSTYERRLRVQESRHKEEGVMRDRDVKKLQGQLLVSHDRNLAWPDEKLKHRIGEVRRLIDNATAQLAAAGVVPRGRALPSRLDPSQRLPKVKGKAHFWLRSVVWGMLQSAFFSLPFGFGAFGPDAGANELISIYREWRTRLDGQADLDPRASATFDIFRRFPLSNKWRSVTFQSLALNMLVEVDGHDSFSGSGALVQLGQQNVAACVRRIVSFVSELAAMTDASVYPELEEEITSAARISFEIALQFGVNQAALALLTSSTGQAVVIGPEFHDCEDGEENRGMRTRVAVMISPGLVRVGDGRSEMAKRHVVFPCEIFSSDDA